MIDDIKFSVKAVVFWNVVGFAAVLVILFD